HLLEEPQVRPARIGADQAEVEPAIVHEGARTGDEAAAERGLVPGEEGQRFRAELAAGERGPEAELLSPQAANPPLPALAAPAGRIRSGITLLCFPARSHPAAALTVPSPPMAPTRPGGAPPAGERSSSSSGVQRAPSASGLPSSRERAAARTPRPRRDRRL